MVMVSLICLAFLRKYMCRVDNIISMTILLSKGFSNLFVSCLNYFPILLSILDKLTPVESSF